MSMNSFGHLFAFSTFGESHGEAVGVVVDGCPPGIPITEEEIQVELDRRRLVYYFSFILLWIFKLFFF